MQCLLLDLVFLALWKSILRVVSQTLVGALDDCVEVHRQQYHSGMNFLLLFHEVKQALKY